MREGGVAQVRGGGVAQVREGGAANGHKNVSRGGGIGAY